MSKIKDMAEIYAAEKMHFLAVVGDSDDDSQEQLLQDAYEDGADAVLNEIAKFINPLGWDAFPITNFERLRSKIEKLKGV